MIFFVSQKSLQTLQTKAAHLLVRTLIMSTKKSTNTSDNSADSWQVDYPKAQKIASPNYTAGRLKPISVKYEDNKTKN
jgi:predicted  nucleic acid-binding Zn ribbon protein